jgi:hypothetical protein
VVIGALRTAGVTSIAAGTRHHVRDSSRPTGIPRHHMTLLPGPYLLCAGSGPGDRDSALAGGSFLAAAVGSTAATTLWSAGGWNAVTFTGAALCCFALTGRAVGRRGPLRNA